MNTIQSALEHQSASIRGAAALVLVNIPTPLEYTIYLENLLKDPDCRVRATSAFVLGRIHSTESVKAIELSAREEYYIVREQAAFALGEIGDANSVTTLVELLVDESISVRAAAQQALLQIGSKKAVAAVVDYIKKGDELYESWQLVKTGQWIEDKDIIQFADTSPITDAQDSQFLDLLLEFSSIK